MRRSLHCLSVAVGFLAAAGAGQAAEPALPAGDPLHQTVCDIRRAIRTWDFAAMTTGAGRLAAVETRGDADDEYRQQYWRGVALLHAVFYARESTGDEEIRSRGNALRNEALAALEQAVALRKDSADAQAAMAALLGMSIQAGNWLTALRLGPRLMRHQRAAEQAAPNPRAMYLLGVGELRGGREAGRLESARKMLLEAVALFEAEQEIPAARDLEPRWGYDHALMFLGDVCLLQGRPEEASAWHEQARNVNPNLRKNREPVQ